MILRVSILCGTAGCGSAYKEMGQPAPKPAVVATMGGTDNGG